MGADARRISKSGGQTRKVRWLFADPCNWGLVATLQDQYLVKVAPPESRINLRPLGFFAASSRAQAHLGRPKEEASVESFVQLLSERVWEFATDQTRILFGKNCYSFRCAARFRF